MKDTLLGMLFEQERWRRAIGRAVDKDMRRDQLTLLTRPDVRATLYAAIRDGKYRISPPHEALIPKDTPGEWRTVYVNEPADRVVLSIINDMLFETCPDMVHPACRSYLRGIGCDASVRDAAHAARDAHDVVIGWKSDLSKYFDSVPAPFIEKVFDDVERRTGHSAVIDMLRDYYRSDVYIDREGAVCRRFQSLKQGCAVAAFLADAVLHHVDGRLSSYDGFYLRYSDDMLFIGGRADEAMGALRDELAAMGMTLNPKKVETLRRDRWFTFLGYAVRGGSISLSGKRLRTFAEEIRQRTTKRRDGNAGSALRAVHRFLYNGGGERSWAMQVLRTVNVRRDIDTLNAFVLDALRATATRARHIGGLSYNAVHDDGCIIREKGASVRANRERTPKAIDGYLTLACARNALLTRREAYLALTADLR